MLLFDHFFINIFTSITQVFSHPEIARPESIYNHRVVWRFLDAVVAVLPTCNFYTGETRLKAITQELRRQGRSSSHYYNADGIIFDDKLDLELGLLETSGPFNVDDPTRETNDFIKAAYRLMVMLHIIAYKYIYADADIFMRLEVCFIHAAKDRIQIWTFRLVKKKKLYVLNPIKSAILCIKPTNSMQDIKNMTNTIWKLKVSMSFLKSKVHIFIDYSKLLSNHAN